MSDLQCRWLAFGVLALGSCASVPFFKKPVPRELPGPTEPAPHESWNQSGDLTLQVSSASAATEVESSPAPHVLSPPSSQAEPVRSLKSVPTLAERPLPQFPAQFVAVLPVPPVSPLPDPLQTASDVSPAFAATATESAGNKTHDGVAAAHGPMAASHRELTAREKDEDTESTAIRRLPPVEPSTTAIVKHRVVDGDSLEQLAERYLGSRERANEIFAANRGRLPAPDLLPLGVELDIGRVAEAIVGDVGAEAATPLGGVQVAAAMELVPLRADEVRSLQTRPQSP
jgi:hypothetical protein